MSCCAPSHFQRRRIICPLVEQNISDFQLSLQAQYDDPKERIVKWLNYDSGHKHAALRKLKERIMSGLRLFSSSPRDIPGPEISEWYWLQRAASCETGFSDFD